jgi:anti-anti-sigma regulatory factor
MDAITLSLPQSLDISLVNEVKSMAIEKIQSNSSPDHINLDAQELIRIDTAGLQLLTAIVIDLNRHKINFSWKNISDELASNSALLGLNELLKLN